MLNVKSLVTITTIVVGLGICLPVNAQATRNVAGYCEQSTTAGLFTGTCTIRTILQGNFLIVELNKDLSLDRPKFSSEVRGRRLRENYTVRLAFDRSTPFNCTRWAGTTWARSLRISPDCYAEDLHQASNTWRDSGCAITYEVDTETGEPRFTYGCGSAINFVYYGNLPYPNTLRGDACLQASLDAQRAIAGVEDAYIFMENTQRMNRDMMIKSGYPASRNLKFLLVLTGRNALTILNDSPVFRKTIASSIIENCSSVGQVTFGLYQTSNIVDYGIINGKVEQFKCLSLVLNSGRDSYYIDEESRRRFDTPPWGYMICGI